VIKAQPGDLVLSPDGPLAALVFKTLSDPYTGRITLMRVFSGRVNSDATVYNANRETEEKLGGLFFLQGKEQIPAGQANAGDIVATAKLKVTLTGDTLCAKGADINFEPIKFPEPSISFAIEPKTRADEDKISQATHRITEEDPTIRIERDPETSQLLISGNGELHVRIVTEKLKSATTLMSNSSRPKSLTARQLRAGQTFRGNTRNRQAVAGSTAMSRLKWSLCLAVKTSNLKIRYLAERYPRTIYPQLKKVSRKPERKVSWLAIQWLISKWFSTMVLTMK